MAWPGAPDGFPTLSAARLFAASAERDIGEVDTVIPWRERRARIRLAVGGHWVEELVVQVQPRMSAEIQKGRHAVSLSIRPLGPDQYHQDLSGGEYVNLKLTIWRLCYRRYQGRAGRWGWFWEVGGGGIQLAVETETATHESSPLGYLAAGLGGRAVLGRGRVETFLDVSAHAISSGGGAEVEEEHAGYSDYRHVREQHGELSVFLGIGF